MTDKKVKKVASIATSRCQDTIIMTPQQVSAIRDCTADYELSLKYESVRNALKTHPNL